MSLLDNLSENLDSLRENVGEVAKKIQFNSKELKEQTLLRLEISKEERKLSDLYRNIGEAFYSEHNKLSNYTNSYIEDEILEIDRVVAKIEALKIKLGSGSTVEKTEDFEKRDTDNIVYIDEEDLKK